MNLTLEAIRPTHRLGAPEEKAREPLDIQRLLALHRPQLRRCAYKMCGNRADADDLVQDCLERAIRRWNQLRSTDGLRSWLLAILHNVWLSDRRTWRRAGGDPVEFDETVFTVREDQEQGLFVTDLLRQVQTLPSGRREIVALVAFEGLSYRDAASAAGVPLGTVMSRLHRARADIQRELASTR